MAAAAVAPSGQGALSLTRLTSMQSLFSGSELRCQTRGSRCSATLVLESPSVMPVPSTRSTAEPTSNGSGLDGTIFFFEAIGVDSDTVFSKYPAIVTVPLSRLEAALAFLKSCGLQGRELSRIARNWPQVLGCSVDERLQPNLDFLVKEVGVEEKDMKKLLTRAPRILATSIDYQLRPALEYLQSVGFTDLGVLVCNNPTVLSAGIETKLKPKFEYLKSLGFSHECTVGMVWRFPSIFNYSIETNLAPKVEYLTKEMGRGVEELTVFPQFFGYSLEQRIKPRHEYLVARNLRISLANMLKPEDEVFFKICADVSLWKGRRSLVLAASSQAVPGPD